MDYILSDFASLLCGMPQGSVLRTMKCCLYLLPLGALTFTRMIPNSTFSFKCKDPLESLTKLGMCISDISVEDQSFHFRSIRRIRNLPTFDAIAQLIHALITTHL